MIFFKSKVMIKELSERLYDLERRVLGPRVYNTPAASVPLRLSGGPVVDVPVAEILQAILDYLDLRVTAPYEKPAPKWGVQRNSKPEPPEQEGNR